MSDIILSTLNARYIHASLGLRYLHANLGELKARCQVQEFTISNRAIDIAELLLKENPKIIGFGIYIWNVTETTDVVAMLKQIAPEVIIVLGGPEISFEIHEQQITNYADYIVTGQGEKVFPQLCQQILSSMKPLNKVIAGGTVPLEQLLLPYGEYTEEDIEHRVVYLEASRGCPFKCEFCLSSLDKTAKPFELNSFLQEVNKLYDRGLRNFKFVDRTFNLKIATTIKILNFFLERMDVNLYLHFELIPDHLPDALKEIIQKFPDGSLQFEIGIQSFDSEVQALISRKQNNEKSKDNLRWLREESSAHLHVDLLFGLPGQDVDSFADSFNQLVALRPHEIQVGILKRLRGSPITRHTEAYKLVFNPHAPYNILSTDRVDFMTLQHISRFARYWDLMGNSGRFKQFLPLLLADNAFAGFSEFSQYLYIRSEQTHKISLRRLFELAYSVTCEDMGMDQKKVEQALFADFSANQMKGVPEFMRNYLPNTQSRPMKRKTQRNSRQARHLLH